MSGRRISHLVERNHDETSVDVHFRALLWIQAQRKPTIASLAAFLGCSRATACRYLAAWRRQTGQVAASPVEREDQPTTSPRQRARARGPHPWSRRHAR